MRRIVRWVLERLANVVFDVIAGIILYLILEGYISHPLSQLSPQIPALLAVSLILAIVLGFLYRLFKSIQFHRFVEKSAHSLRIFLEKWDELGKLFVDVVSNKNSETISKFEEIRSWVQYNYPNVQRLVKGLSRYSYYDPISGILVRDYDVIANLVSKSPFTRMEWFNIHYIEEEFKEQWDIGRTVLLYAIGCLDQIRNGITHSIYRLLHIV
ncbi:MAG: hypothetical protein QXD69_03200 [Candidatus Bathyarchaeia archaeon]